MQIKKAKIARISLLGELPTFDLTVGDDHSYIANGVVTHNTNRYRHVGVNF
jgi:intein/homing endonuclease